MSTVFACNLDDKPGALCRDGCSHPWILYVPMASGYRCDRCRTFASVEISNYREQEQQFHKYHSAQVRCGEIAATTPREGSQDDDE